MAFFDYFGFGNTDEDAPVSVPKVVAPRPDDRTADFVQNQSAANQGITGVGFLDGLLNFGAQIDQTKFKREILRGQLAQNRINSVQPITPGIDPGNPNHKVKLLTDDQTSNVLVIAGSVAALALGVVVFKKII